MPSIIQQQRKLRTAIALVVIILSACKKEGEKLQLQAGAFPSDALSVNTGSVSLTAANINDTAVIFKWPAVTYGLAVPVSYTLQLDQLSDTAGPNGWANATSYASSALTQAIIGADLNNFATAAGFTPGLPSPVAARVLSKVVQQNGAASGISPLTSNTIIFLLTPPPFPSYLFVPGAYQGWDPGAADRINQLTGKAGLYEGYEYITGQYFKFTDAPDWDHTNYGDGGNGSFTTDGLAGGLSVPEDGYYELTANLVTNKWTATRTTWGIIGDATPGTWDHDTPMTYDPATKTWKVTAHMIQAGSFKFRANSAWTIDFGIDNSGKLVYADNPFYGYTAGLNNLSVPADGDYTITLDLHVSGNYTYQLIKN
jgi:hypothetical protein